MDSKLRLIWSADFYNRTMAFTLTLTDYTWLGFGYSPTGQMLGSEVIICHQAPDGSTYLSSEYLLEAKTEQGVVPNKNQSDFTRPSSCSIDQGATTMYFEKTLWNDGDVSATTETALRYVWAYGVTGEQTVHLHAAKGVHTIQLHDHTTHEFDATTFRIVHGSLMFAALGVILPAGGYVSGFMQERWIGGQWFRYYWKISVLGVLVASCGIALAIYFTEESGASHFVSTHALVGAITYILLLMQSVGFVVRPKIDDEGREAWEVWQLWNGRAMLGGGAAAIALGAIQIGLDAIAAYAYAGIMGVVYISLVASRMCRRKDEYSMLEYASHNQPSYTPGKGYTINDAGY